MHFILRTIYLQFFVSSFCSSLEILYTCCPHQNEANNIFPTLECMNPSYEFEFETFPQKWEVPSVIIARNDGNRTIVELQTRPGWCKCSQKEHVRLTFVRKNNQQNNNKDSSWTLIHPNYQELNISLELGQNSPKFLFNSKKYASGQFCIKRLEEQFPNFNTVEQEQGERGLKLELVVCSELCVSPKKEGTLKIGKFENQPLKSCREQFEENKNCPENSWATLYYAEEKFYVIKTKTNTTHAISDASYPWGFFSDQNLLCKVEAPSETSGTILKYCISQIKHLFYGQFEIYAILCGISASFLLLNLSVYFCLREHLSISGWTEFIYCGSLYAYFVLSIIGLLVPPESDNVNTFCYVFAVLIQYFDLANSSSLVALSFDIFWTFCKFDSLHYTDDPKLTKFRLSIYILFSVLFPAAIVLFGVLKNMGQWDPEPSLNFGLDLGTPQYGLFLCVAPQWTLQSWLSFGMQGLNLQLVLLSAYLLVRKTVGRSKGQLTNFSFEDEEEFQKLDLDRLDIFSKLLMFVFIFWILGFLEFFCTGEKYSEFFKYFQYSQGLFAFLILICNRKTLRGIFQRGTEKWSLKSLFAHACCTSKSTGKSPKLSLDSDSFSPEELPMSPLMAKMKSTSIRRSTVKGNAFY